MPCKNKLIDYIRFKLPFSVGVMDPNLFFKSFLCYPSELKLTWDYGKTHNFKGPPDGIGGALERKVYQHVSLFCVVVSDAKHFATFVNEVCNVDLLYSDQLDIREFTQHQEYDYDYVNGCLS